MASKKFHPDDIKKVKEMYRSNPGLYDVMDPIEALWILNEKRNGRL